jgi:hypothetical protein
VTLPGFAFAALCGALVVVLTVIAVAYARLP